MARIIAADDDPGLQRIYFYMLDSLGHEAVICCNGEEAVGAFLKNGADLVILDVTMPVMDGLEACRRIKQLPEGINVPVVIVSAVDSEREISAGFNAGADDYMLKPIKENILIAKLKNFLKTSSLHRREFDMVRNRMLFLERYRIMKVCGYGAHSVVFLADDIQEQRQVAVKMINENVSGNDAQRCFVKMVNRFRQLECPNIAGISDYGVYQGQLYMIMDYAEQGNLRQLITTRHLNEFEASKLALDMITALETLQKHDLLHLDIKPENIIISDGCYKLTDFGMVLSRDPGTMPLQAEVWGTAAYICPEYLEESAELSISSDIYGLGVTLFESVVGDNPFFSGKSTVSMFRQVNLIPPYLASLTGDTLSFEFSDVIAAMMCKDPADRPDLETLRDWFASFVDCYNRDAARAELHYPKPEQKKAFISTQESTLRKRREVLKLTPKKKSALAQAVDRTGDAMFKSLLMRQQNRREQLRKLIPVLIILACLTFFAYPLLSSLKYRTARAQNIEPVMVMCRKCGHLEERKIRPIAKYSCSSCRGELGYPYVCDDCGKNFAWMTPRLTRNLSNEEKMKRIAESTRCPHCSSARTRALSAKAKKQKTGR